MPTTNAKTRESSSPPLRHIRRQLGNIHLDGWEAARAKLRIVGHGIDIETARTVPTGTRHLEQT
jgi:hypothetical protein